jgi:hypothetical protein
MITNNKILFIVGFIVIIIFIHKLLINNCDNFSNINNIENNDIIKIDTNECSQKCCKHIQWLPDYLKNNNEEYNDYIPSNYSCNFGSNSGCLCISNKDKQFISNHGQNI